MLTPAEELGLSGLSLASRVRKAFFKIPEDAALTRSWNASARNRCAAIWSICATASSTPSACWPVPSRCCPISWPTSTTSSLTIQNALKRLPELYMQDFAVRELLRISPDEEKWLWECWGPSQRENNPIFGRLDAMVDFISPMWKDSLRFVEPNMSGIGGLHLVPTAEQIVAEIVLPVLQTPGRPSCTWTSARTSASCSCRKCSIICRRSAGPPRTSASSSRSTPAAGPTSRKPWPSIFTSARPEGHARRPGRADAEGRRSLLQRRRRSTWSTAIIPSPTCSSWSATGVNVEPMRTLFRQNRIISSIAAELDQKSCWEMLTDPQFTQKYFSAEERQVFRRHILWTRLVSERQTLLPDGQHRRSAAVRSPGAGTSGAEAEPLLSAARAWSSAIWPRAAEWETALDDGPDGPGTLGRAAAGQHSGQRVSGARPRRQGPHRAVLHGDGLRTDQVRPGDAGAGRRRSRWSTWPSAAACAC